MNAGRIDARFAESLSSGVNALVAQTPTCLPPVPAVVVTPEPAPPRRGRPEHKGHEHKHEHKHKGKH